MVSVVYLYTVYIYDEDVYALVEEEFIARAEITDIIQKESNISVVISNVITEKGSRVPKGKSVNLKFRNNQKDSGILNDICIGNIISVKGKAKAYEKAANKGQFDAYRYYTRKGIIYYVSEPVINIIDNSIDISEYARRIRNKGKEVLHNYLSEDEAGIMSAMVFGDKSDMSEEDKEMYQKNGLLHILAVSGLHVSMVSVFLLWIISKLPINFYVGRSVVLAGLLIYGSITGFSVSCIRAVIMLMLRIIARLLGYAYDYPSAISFAGIVTIIINPFNLFGCDFLLSYLAVFSVMTVSGVFCRISPENDMYTGICTGVCSLIVSMPVILYFYYEIPLYSVIINLIVIPLMSVLFMCACLCVGSSLVSSVISLFFSGAVHYILLIYEYICNFCMKWIADIRIVGFPGMKRIIICYLVEGVIFLLAKRISLNKRYRKGLVVLFALFVTMPLMIMGVRSGNRNFYVEYMDVGQGDAIFVRFENGKTMFIDGGSSDVSNVGKYRIEPYLRYMGVRKIDYWIITHMDYDHISGFEEVSARNYINRIDIKMVCTSNAGVNIDKIKEKYGDISGYSFLDTGKIINVGESQVICLNPVKKKEYSELNESSLVLSVVNNGVRFLFTGDIEGEAEEEMLERTRWNDDVLTILKVAHHGSSGSTKNNFLDVIRPQVSIISCGKNNRYGHPHKETVERLGAIKTKIIRTDRNGAAAVEVTGYKKVRISCFRD